MTTIMAKYHTPVDFTFQSFWLQKRVQANFSDSIKDHVTGVTIIIVRGMYNYILCHCLCELSCLLLG